MTTYIILFFCLFLPLCPVLSPRWPRFPSACLSWNLPLSVGSFMNLFSYLLRTYLRVSNHQWELTFVSSVLPWLSTCHWGGSPHRRGRWRAAGWPAKASAWRQHPYHPQHGLSMQVVHTLEEEERETWKSACPVLLIPVFSSSPNSHPSPGPESSLASILCPIPVPDPAVLDPSGNHSPDWRVFFWKEDMKDPKTNTLHH